MKRHTVVLGLTGGFGSGKTSVARMFQDLGAHAVDADKLAHEALRPGSSVYPKVARLFKGARSRHGKLDRKKIAAIVFKNPKQRRKLEALVHPYVFGRMVSEIAQARGPVMVLEIPLLFETGFDAYCHQTVVVAAGRRVTQRRLAKLGFSRAEIEARYKAQMPLKEKRKRAGFVILNSGSLEKTRQQVKKVWGQIRPSLKEKNKNAKRKNAPQ